MRGKQLIKLFVSVAILVYLFIFKVDLAAFVKALKRTHPGWAALALFLHTFGFLISGIRWKEIARVHSPQQNLWFFIQSYLIAAFFALFLPSRFGGDVVRTMDISHHTGFSRGISTILYERAVGLFALVAIGVAAAFLSPHKQVKNFALASGFILTAVFVALLILFLKIEFFFSLVPSNLRGKLLSFKEALEEMKKQEGLFTKTLILSFLLQVNVIIHYWAIGKALDLPIPFFHYFYIIPIAVGAPSSKKNNSIAYC